MYAYAGSVRNSGKSSASAIRSNTSRVSRGRPCNHPFPFRAGRNHLYGLEAHSDCEVHGPEGGRVAGDELLIADRRVTREYNRGLDDEQRVGAN